MQYMKEGLESPVQKLDFEVREVQAGVVKYVFDHVEVGFATTGKNYRELPEIGFSTF
mgnify:CR=1 FL=1